MAEFQFVAMLFVLLTYTLAEDRNDWIDPHDMINFDPTTNTMSKKNKIVKIPDLDPTDVPTDAGEGNPSPPKDGHSVPCSVRDCSPCPELDCPPCPDVPDNCPICESAERSCPTQEACQCEKKTDAFCDQASLPLLRQYISTLSKHLGRKVPGTDSTDYVMHLSLSGDQVTILERFIAEGKHKHVHDVHEILHHMIQRVATSELGKMEKTALWLEDKIGLKLDRLIQFFVLAALASVVLLLEVKLQIPWRRRVSQLIVIMFIISIPWTWFELYKQAEIKQHSVATKTMPAECKRGEKDYWGAFKSYFTLQDDKCLEYHEHLLIDPVIKVPPTKAIAVTFVRFFVAPLKDVGSAMSEFIRALLIDLPVTLYPIAIGMVGLFLFMFLFMWFGYSIRLPLFVTIERSPQITIAESHLQQTIQESSQQTMKQLEQLQSRLEVTESQLTEKLQNMERVQKVAIEYNMSSESFADKSSPSLSAEQVNPRSNIPRSPSKAPSVIMPPKTSPKKIPCVSKSDVNPRAKMATEIRPPASRARTRLVRSCDNIGAEGCEDIENYDEVDEGNISNDGDEHHESEQTKNNATAAHTDVVTIMPRTS